MICIYAVGAIVTVPVVFVGTALINDVAAIVAYNQFAAHAVIEAENDEVVVETIPVGGEDVGDFDFHGLDPGHLLWIHVLDHRVFLLLAQQGGLVGEGEIG